MAVAMSTPLEEALNSRIQPKLVEIGWSHGDHNSPLGEYICLMIKNGKTQEQIASELSGDLLGLSPDDASATQFARWLFEELDTLRQTMGEGSGQADQNVAPMDEEMGDAEESHEAGPEGAPTAPKAMRNPNGRRIMNQISKAMERKPGDVLHRVRPQASERIGKFGRGGHGGVPTGPSRQGGPPMRGGMNGNNRPFQHRMIGRPYGPNGGMLPQNMNPQQQAQFFQMYQQQSNMIQPFNNGPGPVHNGPGHMRGPRGPHGPHGSQHNMPQIMPQMPQNGGMEDAYSNNLSQPQRLPSGPLQEERPQFGHNNYHHNHNSHHNHINHNNHFGIDMSDDKSETQRSENKSDTKLDEIACKFGLNCTKAECAFGHPSPAAPPGKPYISGEKCPFGTRCKNKKCSGSHPSPASAPNFHSAWAPKMIEQDCKFFPNCTNPACPFKHPAMPMCRNGANCTRPGCHFTHGETACKFNPCLNPNCVYKHEEGQQQLPAPGETPSFGGHKVWTAKTKEHVSERKFVNEGEQEELIIPGQDMDTAPLDVE
ncbi:hypothetical protein FPQ18DRAFT_3964 [Pyronema domesticum]|uniref:Similar to Nuclear polyadenylated RNA-binding protein NAB2 acc. no. P32505 n=1 Tax=Pyronema omphalodes (strain CBS 100304) TaxID=1076935 RepID=U4LUG0_PYROM|nr:hypothetical protein FPQ18DRAFT_3964 [Pyronema domesticum]CCX31626.1 Similar to Nuclear polyadenylated RNA-binding protein NAB2; acc. no. P32505 [Pyronema omphalodes CBS 100304]